MVKPHHIIKKILNGQNAKKKDIKDVDFLSSLSYQTPFFLFDRKKIENNFNQYHRLFPNASIHYAMKANSEPEVLRVLAQSGSGFEVASKYELDLVKKIHVSPSKIIYGTSVKPISHIKEFVKYGVDRFAFDSFSELEKIAANAPKAKVYVRTIANDAGSVFKFSEKFGTDPASIIPLLLKAKELGLTPYGISFHVGSQASDPKAWANVLVTLRGVLEDLSEKSITLEMLDIGGGFPCQYASSEEVPSLKEIAESVEKERRKLPYPVHLLLEPGRGIIADTAVAVATVIARIERRGSTWLFLDLGVYNGLFETMAYQGSTRYAITSLRPVGDAGEMMYEIAGPTGDSPDVITREALLPKDITEGDKVVIHNVGAYSLSVTSEFNGFPKPNSYLV